MLNTLFALLQLFRAEQQSGQAGVDKAFMEWLSRHNHQQVIKYLEDNDIALRSLNMLLTEDREKLSQKLDTINTLVGNVACKIDGLDKVAQALSINEGLSDQALSILRQIVDIECPKFLLHTSYDGALLIPMSRLRYILAS